MAARNRWWRAAHLELRPRGIVNFQPVGAAQVDVEAPQLLPPRTLLLACLLGEKIRQRVCGIEVGAVLVARGEGFRAEDGTTARETSLVSIVRVGC